MKNIDKHKKSIRLALANRTEEEVREQHKKVTESKLKNGYYKIFVLIDSENREVCRAVGAESIAKEYEITPNGLRLAAKKNRPFTRGPLKGYSVKVESLEKE